MQSSLSQLTLMIHKDKQPRMLELLLDLMFNVSLTSQLQLPSPMDWIRRISKSATSLFSTWVVVHSMYLFSVLKMEFSKSRLPMDILTWVVRTLTMFLSTIASLNSRNRLASTSLEMQEQWEDSELNARRQREFFQLPISQKFIVKPLPKVRTSISTFLVPSLRNFASLISENACHLLRTYSRMLTSERVKFMKSSS